MLVILVVNGASSCDAFYLGVRKHELRPPAFLVILPLMAALVCGALEWSCLTRASGFKSYEVPSTSMTPTIEKGDRVMADMRAFSAREPERGDVVVVKRDGITYVKRVIGLPGETVSINGGIVSINGNPITESYVSLTEGPEAFGRDFQATEVPAHSYFLLGDARDFALGFRTGGQTC
jgi:signal peptidase I